jgi:hypothetical protein
VISIHAYIDNLMFTPKNIDKCSGKLIISLSRDFSKSIPRMRDLNRRLHGPVCVLVHVRMSIVRAARHKNTARKGHSDRSLVIAYRGVYTLTDIRHVQVPRVTPRIDHEDDQEFRESESEDDFVDDPREDPDYVTYTELEFDTTSHR